MDSAGLEISAGSTTYYLDSLKNVENTKKSEEPVDLENEDCNIENKAKAVHPQTLSIEIQQLTEEKNNQTTLTKSNNILNVGCSSNSDSSTDDKNSSTGPKVYHPPDLKNASTFMIPLLHGWRREIVWRKTAVSASKVGDVYYYGPPEYGSPKFRSGPDILRFIEKHPSMSYLTLRHFSFSKNRVAQPPMEVEREAASRSSGKVTKGVVKKNIKKTAAKKTSKCTPVWNVKHQEQNSEENNDLVVAQVLGDIVSQICGDRSYQFNKDLSSNVVVVSAGKRAPARMAKMIRSAPKGEASVRFKPGSQKSRRKQNYSSANKKSPAATKISPSSEFSNWSFLIGDDGQLKRRKPTCGLDCSPDGLPPKLECKDCRLLFHPSCLGLTGKAALEKKFVCDNCKSISAKVSSARKPIIIQPNRLPAPQQLSSNVCISNQGQVQQQPVLQRMMLMRQHLNQFVKHSQGQTLFSVGQFPFQRPIQPSPAQQYNQRNSLLLRHSSQQVQGLPFQRPPPMQFPIQSSSGNDFVRSQFNVSSAQLRQPQLTFQQGVSSQSPAITNERFQEFNNLQSFGVSQTKSPAAGVDSLNVSSLSDSVVKMSSSGFTVHISLNVTPNTLRVTSTGQLITIPTVVPKSIDLARDILLRVNNRVFMVTGSNVAATSKGFKILLPHNSIETCDLLELEMWNAPRNAASITTNTVECEDNSEESYSGMQLPLTCDDDDGATDKSAAGSSTDVNEGEDVNDDSVSVTRNPVIQNAVSHSTEDVPNSTENVPNSTENVPNSTENVPNSTEDVSNSTENFPSSTEDVPNFTGDVTRATGDITSNHPTRMDISGNSSLVQENSLTDNPPADKSRTPSKPLKPSSTKRQSHSQYEGAPNVKRAHHQMEDTGSVRRVSRRTVKLQVGPPGGVRQFRMSRVIQSRVARTSTPLCALSFVQPLLGGTQCLDHLFSLLPLRAVLMCRNVCRVWRRLIDSHETLWQHVILDGNEVTVHNWSAAMVFFSSRSVGTLELRSLNLDSLVATNLTLWPASIRTLRVTVSLSYALVRFMLHLPVSILSLHLRVLDEHVNIHGTCQFMECLLDAVAQCRELKHVELHLPLEASSLSLESVTSRLQSDIGNNCNLVIRQI